MHDAHTHIQTHTCTHTRAVPHTHVRCRCGGKHTETGASLITTPLPSQHLPHSRERFRVWREEQAASAWASAVQAASPSAPSSMSRLTAAPAPPMCTHTPTYTHQSLYTCRTHIPKHAQHATAGRQAASCSPHLLPLHLSLSPLPPPSARLHKTCRSEAERCFRPLLASSLHQPTHCQTAAGPRAMHPPSHTPVVQLRFSEEREELLATPCVASTARRLALMPQPAPPPLVSTCRSMKSAHCLCRLTCLSSSTFPPVHVDTHGVHECE